MGNFRSLWPTCAHSNPRMISTPGSVGVNDPGDPEHPIERIETRLLLGSMEPFGTITAINASNNNINPLAKPTPLEEVGAVARLKLFEIASACQMKSKKSRPKGLNDSAAVQKASKKVKVGDREMNNFFENKIREMIKDSQKQIINAKGEEKRKLQQGLNKTVQALRKKIGSHFAIADTETMTVIITDNFVKKAQENRKFSTGLKTFEPALAFFRLVYLHEQCHLYLRLRGIHESVEEKLTLDEMLDGRTVKGSCHHNAIPTIERYYNMKFKSKYGYVKNYRFDHG